MTTPHPTHGVTLKEAFGVWARIAAQSFGGPAGQIALMHRVLADPRVDPPRLDELRLDRQHDAAQRVDLPGDPAPRHAPSVRVVRPAVVPSARVPRTGPGAPTG